MNVTIEQTFYIIISLMCVMILGVMLCRLLRVADKHLKAKSLIICNVLAIVVCAVDLVSGFIYYGALQESRTFTYAVSLTAHFSLLFLSYFWFLYSEGVQKSWFIKTRQNQLLSAIPGLAIGLCLISNYYTKIIFFIDDEGIYHRGILFELFIFLECSYAIFSALKALHLSFTEEHYEDRNKLRIVASFVCLPIISSIIQQYMVVSPIISCGIAMGFLYVYSSLQQLYISQDALTGLANMNSFDSYISACIRHKQSHGNIYLISIDIAEFAVINHEYGSGEGDKLLKDVGEIIKKVVHEYEGFIARSGADEFLIVLESANEHTATYVCRQLEKKVRSYNKHSEAAYKLCLSMGYAAYTGQTIPQLICEAAENRKNCHDYNNTYAEGDDSLLAENNGQDAAELDITGLDTTLFPFLSDWSDKNYIFINNLETNVTRWTPNAMEFMGLKGEYMYNAGEKWRSLIHPDEVEGYQKELDAVFTGRKKYFEKLYRIRNKDGVYVSCRGSAQLIKGENGSPDLFVGAITNNGISDNVDSTTNLWDTYMFHKYMENTLARNRNVAVLAIGICKYGHVNNTYGYVLGNDLLRQFADQLFAFVRPNIKLFRLDGAKFAFACEDCDGEKLADIYKEIQEVAQTRLFLGEHNVPLKVAGGAAVVRDYDGETDAILTSATYALETSKHERHGELVFFNNQANQTDVFQVERIAEIHRSVMNDCKGFMLYYQPIVNARTGCIEGAEALLRWQSDKYGFVPPDHFIPWLEEDPCIYILGNWIMETAIKAALDFKKVIPNFFINVNIAATQLENPSFRSDLLDIIDRYHFPKNDLWIELTERCKDLDHNFLKSEIMFFKKNGIQVALDDYGTGASSLSLVIELPVTEVKIDKSFVNDIMRNSLKQALVESVITFARRVNIRCCIEGVENPEVAGFLQKFNPMYYQGYAYSRPIPKEEFMELLNCDGML